jgi:hypothetical protein
MRTMTPSFSHALFVVTCLCLSGCTSALNFNFKQDKVEKETDNNPVEQIVPVWQEAEGPGINPKQVTRGFGGQIYFITRNRGVPSEINGKIRIYLFDDQGDVEQRSKPIHQFDFEPDAWKAHIITTKLGPAYSVFIPYVQNGHNQTECALRIKYTPKDETPLYSQMVKITLGGTRKPADYETVVSPEKESPEATTEVTMPEVSRRTRKPAQNLQQTEEMFADSEVPSTTRRRSRREIEQVSANGDLLERSGVQNAAFESPAGRQRDQGRIRKADYEAEEGSPTKRRSFVGDQNLDFLGNEDEEEIEEMPVRRRAPRRIPDERQTRLPVQEEPQAATPLRTYTISLDQ